ncbi:hypothetical protein FA95DRAFT_1498689 [Auriscalpium vulgare]|uniref:Uncharacterized protein n=1 Tax=Auriscalpium vulgare TaxID=40419 RepID=A0ACB8RHC0_9AGAM|nr:hypothetical protein FA95DRAFT_1498689 [Auriscalpium vulgare]
MSGKTISAGTLNLRFMQNAERAKPGAQSQANTESTPPDESRWEVGQAVQDAWGASRPTSVTYEASYLPFVYAPSSTAGDAPKLRGRRTWNKRGQESIAGAEVSRQPRGLQHVAR